MLKLKNISMLRISSKSANKKYEINYKSYDKQPGSLLLTIPSFRSFTIETENIEPNRKSEDPSTSCTLKAEAYDVTNPRVF